MNTNMNKNVKLSILGSGLIGKAVGKVFARYGFEVIFHDRNRAVLEPLASDGAVRRTNISFICVSSPTRIGEFDSPEVEEPKFKENLFIFSFFLLQSQNLIPCISLSHRSANRFHRFNDLLQPSPVCTPSPPQLPHSPQVSYRRNRSHQKIAPV